MIKKTKQNKKFQFFLRFLNYYVSIGILSLLLEGATIDKNNFLIDIFRKLYNFIYPRDFLTYSLFVVSFISIFILSFKENILIKLSGMLNIIILMTGLFWSLMLYLA